MADHDSWVVFLATGLILIYLVHQPKRGKHLGGTAMEETVREKEKHIMGSRASWLRILFTSLALYFIGLGLLIFTGNPVIFPTVSMIGSFAIPVAYVVFFFQHRHVSTLDLSETLIAFLYGGILGVFASALLEPLFIYRLTPGAFLLIGFIEEFTKAWGLIYIARHGRHRTEMDGLILGAAVGMGFASLESNGYAFAVFLQSEGSLTTMVAVTLLRGLLSPIGHGTWTAIIGGVLFREREYSKFRINRKVIGAYLTVSILHALWDGLPSIIAALFQSGLDVLITQMFIGTVSLLILWLTWREARRMQAGSAEEDCPFNSSHTNP